MATKAKAAKGTLIQRGDGGGTEVFTTIGEVTNFSGPGEEAETIEATSFDSTSKEFISSGLPDNGEVTFSVNFVGSDTQQQGLRADLRAGTLRNFKIKLNDHATNPTTATFAAIVQSLDGPNAGGVSEIYKMDVTLKLSGPATWTYAPA